jgi:hypothetical protein
MSKHKKAGDKRDKVGKAGSPPSNTENEKPRTGKGKRTSMPKEGKKDSGSERRGGGLH